MNPFPRSARNERLLQLRSEDCMMCEQLLQQQHLETPRYEDDPVAVADLSGSYPRDLTGFRFGKLLVTSKSPYEPNGWRVSCDCGAHTVRSRRELVGGRCKSGGCGQKATQFVSPMAPSLVGQQFGRLRVVERVDHPQEAQQGAFYRCACECGGETVTKASHLRSGHTTSCGCKTQETRFQPGSNEPPLAAPEHSGRRPKLETRQQPEEWKQMSWAERKAAIWERAQQPLKGTCTIQIVYSARARRSMAAAAA